MTQIPEHLLRRAQRATRIVHNGNWTRLETHRCDACDHLATWITKHGPIERLCEPCHDALAEEYQ